MADKADLGFSTFAHAAFVRICGTRNAAVQSMSSEQSFRLVINSDRKLHIRFVLSGYMRRETKLASSQNEAVIVEGWKVLDRLPQKNMSLSPDFSDDLLNN